MNASSRLDVIVDAIDEHVELGIGAQTQSRNGIPTNGLSVLAKALELFHLLLDVSIHFVNVVAVLK